MKAYGLVSEEQARRESVAELPLAKGAATPVKVRVMKSEGDGASSIDWKGRA